VLASAVCLAACQSIDLDRMGLVGVFGPDNDADTASSTPAEPDGARHSGAKHQIAPGDLLRIETSPPSAWTGAFTVDRDGRITAADGTVVPVTGAPLNVVERKVAQLIEIGSGDVTRVDIRILNPSPVYILGEVNSPGEFAYADTLSIPRLVHLAGGYTHRADLERVIVTRQGADEQMMIDEIEALTIQPGDVIQVPQRYF